MTTLPAFIEANHETWAPIPGYEGKWEASSEGRIRSVPRKRSKGGLLTARVNKRGYLSVALSHERLEVHRLVALAFLGPRPDGHVVRHIDGDKLNVRVTNLAYGTPSENIQDQLAHGSHLNASKTHCSRGHSYSGANLVRIPSRPTYRYCRECLRINGAKVRAKKRQARAAAAEVAELSNP